MVALKAVRTLAPDTPLVRVSVADIANYFAQVDDNYTKHAIVPVFDEQLGRSVCNFADFYYLSICEKFANVEAGTYEISLRARFGHVEIFGNVGASLINENGSKVVLVREFISPQAWDEIQQKTLIPGQFRYATVEFDSPGSDWFWLTLKAFKLTSEQLQNVEFEFTAFLRAKHGTQWDFIQLKKLA